MRVKRALIVRHGETDFNAEKRWQGWMPTPLNEKGREQAALLAQYLNQEPIDVIFSSDLERAVETIQPTAAALKLPIKTDERFREIDLGVFQGLTAEQINYKYPLEWAAWRADYYHYVVPGGESRVMVGQRAYSGWLDITQNAKAQTLLLMSHGGTIRMLLHQILGEGEWMHADFSNTSITKLEAINGNWKLVSTAQTPHLND